MPPLLPAGARYLSQHQSKVFGDRGKAGSMLDHALSALAVAEASKKRGLGMSVAKYVQS
jgi:hypothetical protein